MNSYILVHEIMAIPQHHDCDNCTIIESYVSVMFPKLAKLLDLIGVEAFDISYFVNFTKSLIEERRKLKEVGKSLTFTPLKIHYLIPNTFNVSFKDQS